MTYISPDRRFDDDTLRMVKAQIANSAELGQGDLLLATNFPFSYGSVRAVELTEAPPEEFLARCTAPFGLQRNKLKCTKVWAVRELARMGVLEGRVWFHDIDAFQCYPFPDDLPESEWLFTHYGWMLQPNSGSFFFRPEHCLPTLDRWVERMLETDECREEIALVPLLPDVAHEFLNPTYNFGSGYPDLVYPFVRLPILVAHFYPFPHPKGHWECFCEAHNPLKVSFVGDRLRNLLRRHGFVRFV